MKIIQETKFTDLPISKPRKSEINFDEIISRFSGAKNMFNPTTQIFIELFLSMANKIVELEEKIKELQS